jgi:hypothetical protein
MKPRKPLRGSGAGLPPLPSGGSKPPRKPKVDLTRPKSPESPTQGADSPNQESNIDLGALGDSPSVGSFPQVESPIGDSPSVGSFPQVESPLGDSTSALDLPQGTSSSQGGQSGS